MTGHVMTTRDVRRVVAAAGATPAVVGPSEVGCRLGDLCEQVARSGATVTLEEWHMLRRLEDEEAARV
jgi:hypothetical protein